VKNWHKVGDDGEKIPTKRKFDALYVIGLFIILLISFVMGYKGCTSGSKSSDYKIVCIQGHQYFRSNFMQKMGLSIRLDSEGKPIPCSNME